MKRIPLLANSIILLFLLSVSATAQTLPELMYFRFNTVNAGVTPNDAPVLTRVCAGGTLNGAQTIGGTGQFGAGVVGVAGASSANNINTGWATNLPGDWTISLWLNSVSTTGTKYYFGDVNTSSLRCFSGGAAGVGLRLTGPFTINTTIPLTPGPTVVHFVHNDAANTVSAYVNGVFDVSVSTAAGNLNGAGPFYVSAYSGANNCLEGTMDEFRMYNRALSVTEIANTWNVDLFAAQCPVPTNLATGGVTSGSVNITWTPVVGSTGYEYVVDQSATPPAGAGTPIANTSVTETGLASSTTYYVHVRNVCGATASSSWITRSFTTLVNPCLPPGNMIANTPTASDANFSWDAVAGSQGYEYAVTSTSATPVAGITPTASTNGFGSGLTGGATYYLHVRNRCSPTSLSNWATISFIMPQCEKPVNIIVSNISPNSADIVWSAMPSANAYEYVVDQSAGDPGSGSGATTSLGISAQLTALTPNTKYYIHLRTLCFINDVSDWALDSFTTFSFCGAPNLIVTNANTSSPTVSWDSVGDAMIYEYQMSTSATPPAFGIETSATSHILALPFDGKKHYVHARTKCLSQFTFSGWSTAVLRDIGTSVNDLDNQPGPSIVAYPNPVKDRLTIHIADPEADAIVSVLDLTGKALRQVTVSGDNCEIDFSDLSAGVYMLKYSSGSHSQSIKIHKQ